MKPVSMTIDSTTFDLYWTDPVRGTIESCEILKVLHLLKGIILKISVRPDLLVFEINIQLRLFTENLSSESFINSRIKI
jgi:hypothetical protein